MTLTSRLDGDDASTGASYLEIARVLIDHGANTAADLRELCSRIVFKMLVSQWHKVADSLKIRAREQERMAAAFRLAG